MKKLLSTCLTILAVVFLLGLVMGSQGEYGSERILWRIQNDFQKMINQPQSIPEGAVSDIVGRYEQFIRRHPKSSLTPKAQLSIGNIYVFYNDYPKSREIFEEIIKNYSYNADIVTQAQFALGKSYEDEGNWNKANALYKKIISDYPLTSTGFSVPFYIVQYHASRGSKKLTHDALDEAVEFYQNIAVNNANGPLEYAALRMLTECRWAQENWRDAFDVAKQLMFQYPSAPTLFDTVIGIRNICVGKLNDTGCAVNTYLEFMHKNPGHPINPKLKRIIANINDPKYRNTTNDPVNKNEK